VQAALYTSQNVNPKVPIQRLKPRNQVPSWAKNALHLEHFVMPKKIKMITFHFEQLVWPLMKWFPLAEQGTRFE
jgi:hypothetical protein